ncbi:hypothetical protein [Rhodopirellula europaea]|uniref:hypothetical protein n=1 Tax=Rhodopirellula europaea TaxID=1263866 RepID=UPI003D2A93F0
MNRHNTSGPLRSGDYVPTPRPSRPAAAASGGRGGGKGGNGGNHQPPRLTASSPASQPKKPGLTPIFNEAAKQPDRPPVKTHAQKIADLKKQLSQPKPTLELTPRGVGTSQPNPKRDREIHKQIETIKATVAKQRERIKQDFSKAAARGTAKRSFNKASRGR